MSNSQTDENNRTTYARAVLEYDKQHEDELLSAITKAIVGTSMVSDCNAAVIRTGEIVEALVTVLVSVLAMSPSVSRSPTAIRKTVDRQAPAQPDCRRREQRGLAGISPPDVSRHQRGGQRVDIALNKTHKTVNVGLDGINVSLERRRVLRPRSTNSLGRSRPTDCCSPSCCARGGRQATG